MGVNIAELLPKKEIGFKDLSGKIIAVDASLFLYQFLSSIRQSDGQPLTDQNGNVTSHLSGLFSRTVRLMNYGMKLCYVFDGKAPDLKQKERDRRRAIKEDAKAKYQVAKQEGNTADMKKFASRTSRLTPEMVKESKELLHALGVPTVQAPSEAEAQAAYMVKKGDAYALASQDADTLMFGTPLLIKNLSLIGRRKKAGALAYQTIKPELITLSEVLNTLGIDQDKLIALSMLVGTDFNVGGIKGIGPKNALKYAKEYEIDDIFKEVRWDDHFDIPWTEIFYLIKKMPTTDDYDLKWTDIDETKVQDILVSRHGFGEDRIMSSLKKMMKEKKDNMQKGLGDFL
jgi:flap endonuclease-1